VSTYQLSLTLAFFWHHRVLHICTSYFQVLQGVLPYWCFVCCGCASIGSLLWGLVGWGHLSVRIEGQPTLGMKGLDCVCSTAFGEGAFLFNSYLSFLAGLQVPVRRLGPGFPLLSLPWIPLSKPLLRLPSQAGASHAPFCTLSCKPGNSGSGRRLQHVPLSEGGQ
jgi:hypothetical protein